MRYLFFLIVLVGCSPKQPSDFVYITDISPTIEIEARYATPNNFMGRIVKGYESSKLMLTLQAATALHQVQAELYEQGLGLKIFDAYRPQQAVDEFVDWCAEEGDSVNKQTYYPNVEKSELLAEGYIAAKSGHSRGSTVDLTIIDLSTEKELDMGTPWDYFGPESHGDFYGVSNKQKANRQLLQSVMKKHGFKPLPEEWWHFTLVNEPYPDTYFDFVVR